MGKSVLRIVKLTGYFSTERAMTAAVDTKINEINRRVIANKPAVALLTQAEFACFPHEGLIPFIGSRIIPLSSILSNILPTTIYQRKAFAPHPSADLLTP